MMKWKVYVNIKTLVIIEWIVLPCAIPKYAIWYEEAILLPAIDRSKRDDHT